LGSAQNPLDKCSPDPLAEFKGHISKVREGTGRKGREEKGRSGGKGEILCSSKNSLE